MLNTKILPRVALSVLLAAAFIPNAQAELVATPLRGDSRLVQFKFDEDNTFLVLSKPRAVTHVQFAPDEQIQTVAAGDTQSWELTPTKNRRNLFIKPKFEDTTTSLTVLTDKRSYQFVLQSTADGKKWYQRVSWLYDGDVMLELESAGAAPMMPAPVMPTAVGAESQTPMVAPMVQPMMGMQRNGCGTGMAIQPTSMQFNYKVSGDAAFKPTMVFNDGRFTYFRMPSDMQEMPALFAVIEDTNYSLVNYTVDCDYLVAQRVLDAAVLKLGKTEVKVDLVKPAKRGFFSRAGD